MNEGVRRVTKALRVVTYLVAAPVVVNGLAKGVADWPVNGPVTLALWWMGAAAMVAVGCGVAWIIDGFNSS